MATFHLIEPYKDYSGKTCKHSNIINCLGRTGVRRDKQWTTQVCHPRNLKDNPLSSREGAARARFKAVRAAVMAVKNDSEDFQEAAIAFQAVKAQYKSFDAYLWKIEGDKYDAAQED